MSHPPLQPAMQHRRAYRGGIAVNVAGFLTLILFTPVIVRVLVTVMAECVSKVSPVPVKAPHNPIPVPSADITPAPPATAATSDLSIPWTGVLVTVSVCVVAVTVAYMIRRRVQYAAQHREWERAITGT